MMSSLLSAAVFITTLRLDSFKFQNVTEYSRLSLTYKVLQFVPHWYSPVESSLEVQGSKNQQQKK